MSKMFWKSNQFEISIATSVLQSYLLPVRTVFGLFDIPPCGTKCRSTLFVFYHTILRAAQMQTSIKCSTLTQSQSLFYVIPTTSLTPTAIQSSPHLHFQCRWKERAIYSLFRYYSWSLCCSITLFSRYIDFPNSLFWSTLPWFVAISLSYPTSESTPPFFSGRYDLKICIFWPHSYYLWLSVRQQKLKTK